MIRYLTVVASISLIRVIPCPSVVMNSSTTESVWSYHCRVVMATMRFTTKIAPTTTAQMYS
jgi:hypothetical protein